MPKTKAKSTKKKSKTGSRYPEGKYPAYDYAYEQATKNSPILNPSKRNVQTQHLTEPKSGLVYLEGEPDKNNYYEHNGSWYLGQIPHAENELKEVHRRFQNWAKEQVRRAKTLKPPKEWPEELLTLRLSREAILDVRRAEAAALRQTIKDRKAEKERERLAKVLPHGPLGKTSGHYEMDLGKRVNLIDGQMISHSAEGVPYISEETSPYHGMPIYYYTKMAKKWTNDIGITNEQLYKEREELHRQARKEAYKNGDEPPTSSPSISTLKKEKLAEITKDDFPEWPADAVPVNELTK